MEKRKDKEKNKRKRTGKKKPPQNETGSKSGSKGLERVELCLERAKKGLAISLGYRYKIK
ncbi:MAG: hypothetical protein AB1585_04085 [Thermodesulfobacteriota bacterium]